MKMKRVGEPEVTKVRTSPSWITLVPLVVIRYVILPLAPTEVTSRVLT